ncbi:hypothetical protein LMH87_001938 [Akanthomyces muscarius]|uniref:Uncharacterized protein n=1 Tax=Akanthomyces muscarius TaxID=2231603 RepID=A0A9W8Q652_AKAMU|nr:hypothetical protein LMH87_001938 [Akanthomyces muscarius]KAJ4147417.1 hypothetical protein LMH87_001938 [Akanthomyces muscarius]
MSSFYNPNIDMDTTEWIRGRTVSQVFADIKRFLLSAEYGLDRVKEEADNLLLLMGQDLNKEDLTYAVMMMALATEALAHEQDRLSLWVDALNGYVILVQLDASQAEEAREGIDRCCAAIRLFEDEIVEVHYSATETDEEQGQGL